MTWFRKALILSHRYSVIALTLGGTADSAIGLIMGLKRLGRSVSV
jgi:hypothetical protein